MNVIPLRSLTLIEDYGITGIGRIFYDKEIGYNDEFAISLNIRDLAFIESKIMEKRKETTILKEVKVNKFSRSFYASKTAYVITGTPEQDKIGVNKPLYKWIKGENEIKIYFDGYEDKTQYLTPDNLLFSNRFFFI